MLTSIEGNTAGMPFVERPALLFGIIMGVALFLCLFGGLLWQYFGTKRRIAACGVREEDLLWLAIKQIRRITVAVIGATIILVGIALIVLPGPATVVIPAGIAVLATEFVWAKRLLRRIREEGEGFFNRAMGKEAKNDKNADSDGA